MDEKLLTKKDFLAALERPRRTKKVDVPSMGGLVYIRKLTLRERDKIGEVDSAVDLAGPRARMLAMCLCEKGGKRLFTDADIEAQQLAAIEADDDIEELLVEIMEFNGLRKDKEDVEIDRGNSGETKAGDSATG